MAQYETRSWIGWHHHMTLVGLAHLFVNLARRALKKKLPELTLDRTVRLLEAAFEEPVLALPRAMALVVYHVRRNKIAKASHDKTWKEHHKGLVFLRLWNTILILERNGLQLFSMKLDPQGCSPSERPDRSRSSPSRG